jgi:hypothetical protein
LYVNGESGEGILTAREGVMFRGDGHIDGENDFKEQPPSESHWVSEYAEDQNFIRTNCLLVNGRAVRTPVNLEKNQWRLTLSEGMHGLAMHIPRGAPLKKAECEESLRGAYRFFRRYFPGQPFETFYCGSWLLEANMRHILPPASGIVQFLDLFRLYPLGMNAWSFIDRVFGVEPTTVKDVREFARTADRSTSLRRAVVDYWLSGGQLGSAGGVIHISDLKMRTDE